MLNVKYVELNKQGQVVQLYGTFSKSQKVVGENGGNTIHTTRVLPPSYSKEEEKCNNSNKTPK